MTIPHFSFWAGVVMLLSATAISLLFIVLAGGFRWSVADRRRKCLERALVRDIRRDEHETARLRAAERRVHQDADLATKLARAKADIDYKTNWHSNFAWLPIELTPVHGVMFEGEKRWLCWVERRKVRNPRHLWTGETREARRFYNNEYRDRSDRPAVNCYRG